MADLRFSCDRMTRRRSGTNWSSLRWLIEVKLTSVHKYLRIGDLCKELAFGTAAPLARHFRLLRGKDLPVALGLFGRHDLAIIAEDHVRADVAHVVAQVQGQPR